MHYFKYILKGFKLNISRFLAVIAIVTLGVGFLVGLLSSSSDIKKAVNIQYKNECIYDLNIKSSVGFSSDNISKIRELYPYETITFSSIIEPTLATHKEKNNKMRFINFDFADEMNQLQLVDGRLPNNKGECVVLEAMNKYTKVDINDTLTIESDTEIESSYNVVGIVTSSVYFGKDKEYNLTQTSRLNIIAFINSFYENTTTITDVYVRYDKLKESDTFSEEYFEELEKYKTLIRTIEKEQLSLRREELFNEEIEKAKAKYGDTVFASIKAEIEEKINTELDSLEYKWHVLDLKSNQSYVSFSNNSKKIDKIAVVFPFFFYFIAALVALTTITRLVEEERSSIGTLKSLGYSKLKIMNKYILYASICAILGSALGVLTGMFVLPYVIHMAFNSLYLMPHPAFIFAFWPNTIAISLMIVTIIFVAMYVTLKSLKEKPAALLQTKAPKPGKRILLERIKVVWRLIPFFYKNTLRNIFRYKRNLIMMMIGVGGCVALLLCAFSIKDSLGNLSKVQYQEIMTYDIRLFNKEEFLKEDINYDGIQEYKEVETIDTTIDNNIDYSITCYYVNSPLEPFISLKDLKGNKIEIKEKSVVIDQQIAKQFNLNKGDNLRLDNIEENYIITDICENHIDNYIYIYKDNIKTNCFLLKVDKNKTDDIIDYFSQKPSINGIEDKNSLSSTYDSMADSLILIVFVIIICSGALAIIVIYNLTNINVNERIKEIATLKVLGYQKGEVCRYIYREITILSLFGILAGFAMGPLLFKFIVSNLHSPGLYFSSYMSPLYFLYAFLITMVFVCFVDLIFIAKLNKVKMVESLKCVD